MEGVNELSGNYFGSVIELTWPPFSVSLLSARSLSCSEIDTWKSEHSGRKWLVGGKEFYLTPELDLLLGQFKQQPKDHLSGMSCVCQTQYYMTSWAPFNF